MDFEENLSELKCKSRKMLGPVGFYSYVNYFVAFLKEKERRFTVRVRTTRKCQNESLSK